MTTKATQPKRGQYVTIPDSMTGDTIGNIGVITAIRRNGYYVKLVARFPQANGRPGHNGYVTKFIAK
jgi:hypothetical protein